MDAAFTLCIYIPSFNRFELVVEQLHRLKIQIADNQSVRVIVRDNASPDPRYQELPRLLGEPIWLSVIRNPGNIGGNGNIAIGFAAPNEADYLWILADDTLIQAGALHTVLRALHDRPDALLIGSLPPETSELRFDAGAVSALMRSGATLISNVVYRVETIAASTESAFVMHPTSFPHFAVLLAALRRSQVWQVTTVPEPSIHEGNIEDRVNDYSASMAGYPLILPLLPRQMRRLEATRWLVRYGYLFRAARAKNRLAYDASRAELRRQLLLAYPALLTVGYLTGWTFFTLRSTRMGARLLKLLLTRKNA